MPQKDYLKEKQEKAKTTVTGIIVLLIFIIIFIGIIVRLAIRSGTNEGFFPLMPTGKDAYEIAKDYIQPTIKSADVEFPDKDYEFSKNSDSVYTITSHFDTRNISGEEVKTEFTVTLKYNGGSSADQHNWTLVKLEEH
ncbi:hypothetical protein [Mucilaginibacter gotjawali]|uniref:Competence protein ComGC n=2 Tax=Mucilaginibacter gotjawali TaxID=1550579 RepID=A0A839SEL7_9SPHI|nr:hypothetical protein [Mucilaginibacter gotjawali]MBB3055733.1 competence protein ComGC [Mucilaginibacter gotjawali]BAU54554.1 hypothetical protein MgSA37_02730 [Mucilaginibacter gotjawali]